MAHASDVKTDKSTYSGKMNKPSKAWGLLLSMDFDDRVTSQKD